MDYGCKSGITFIVSTHSPYMINAWHLDCVRIVKALALESGNATSVGSLFINDFSMLGYGKADTLSELRKVLGTNIEFDTTRLIFVEGIMDYNILNACSLIFDFKDSKRLLFLPIGGLGSGDTESKNSGNQKDVFSKEQEEKAKKLLDFTRLINISKPILLVDSDSSGRAMKKGVGEDSSLKALCVIELEDAFVNETKHRERKKNFKELRLTDIEFLFSEDDRKKFHFESCKEEKQASIVSNMFKNTHDLNSELSGTSKNNFNELFSCIIKFLKGV